jgi:hypothetical protein
LITKAMAISIGDMSASSASCANASAAFNLRWSAGRAHVIAVDVLRADPDHIDARLFERLLDEGRRAAVDRDYGRAAALLGARAWAVARPAAGGLHL